MINKEKSYKEGKNKISYFKVLSIVLYLYYLFKIWFYFIVIWDGIILYLDLVLLKLIVIKKIY